MLLKGKGVFETKVLDYSSLSTHLTHHIRSVVGDGVTEHLRKNWDLNGKELEVLIWLKFNSKGAKGVPKWRTISEVAPWTTMHLPYLIICTLKHYHLWDNRGPSYCGSSSPWYRGTISNCGLIFQCAKFVSNCSTESNAGGIIMVEPHSTTWKYGDETHFAGVHSCLGVFTHICWNVCNSKCKSEQRSSGMPLQVIWICVQILWSYVLFLYQLMPFIIIQFSNVSMSFC